jgi:hypothetical protein
MKDFDVEFMRRAIERTTLNAIVPFFLVCANPATPWYVCLAVILFSLLIIYIYSSGSLQCQHLCSGLSACGSPGSMQRLGSLGLAIFTRSSRSA